MPASRFARPQSSSALEAARVVGDRRVDVLRLAAGAEQRHHEPPRDGRGDVEPVVERDEVQAEVDSGRRPGRGHDAVVGDVEDVGVDSHARVPAPQPLGVHPVRRRAAVVEQARRARGRTRPCRATRASRRARAPRRAPPSARRTARRRGPTSRGRRSCRRARAPRARAALRSRSPSASAPACRRRATSRNSYQGSTMSLRSRPKTSHGIAKSNVSAPWSTTAATTCMAET